MKIRSIWHIRIPRSAIATAIVLIAICFAIVSCELICVHRDQAKAIDRWAGEWVAKLIVAYMKNNDGRWPGGWQDLQVPFQQVTTYASTARLADLEQRIEVDWTADPAKMTQAAQPFGPSAIEVIRLKSGTGRWGGMNPNKIIYNYLIQQNPSGCLPERDSNLQKAGP